MPFHAALQQLKVPVRCTSSTFAKSAGSILPNDLSRRIPALAHIRSTLPHSMVARSTIALTCSKFETSAPSAIATPPALRISSTTVSAGVSAPPVPSRAPPKSLTTTLAPRLANPSACARPRPLPAPVTMATRPSNLIVMRKIPGCGFFHHAWYGNDVRRSSKIDQTDPVGHQRRLFLALDFDTDIGARKQLGRLPQLRLRQRKTPADPRACAHRREETQLVEAVIDPHGRALDHRHHLVGHDAHQRHRQKSVRHGGAERRFLFGALGIDVDELMIFDDIRINIDALLIDQMP